MAAQERAKQAQAPEAPPPAFAEPPPATFSAPPPTFTAPPPATFAAPPPATFAAPPPATFGAPPPPATFAAPASSAPPSFDFLDSFNAPPSFDVSALPPAPKQETPPPAFNAGLVPEAPSAPAFEDLLMDPAPPAMAPPPPPAMAPPQSAPGLDDEAVRAILAMEGMSDADKQQLIQEQMKIMQSIEGKKKSTQVSAADAFEQRSFSAAVQAAGDQIHGPERTRRAIADGSAVTVQCAACDTLLQVTGAAQFMFCPTCQTVTPVVSDISTEDMAQMEADMKLAQELQKEEYASADRDEQREQELQRRKAAATKSSSGSWMEWLGFGTPAPAPAASRSGEEAVEFERGQTASEAPMFACVTDSINSAANYAMSLPQDEEGNVHGVDSSSLLAVPQVGRNKPSQS